MGDEDYEDYENEDDNNNIFSTESYDSTEIDSQSNIVYEYNVNTDTTPEYGRRNINSPYYPESLGGTTLSSPVWEEVQKHYFVSSTPQNTENMRHSRPSRKGNENDVQYLMNESAMYGMYKDMVSSPVSCYDSTHDRYFIDAMSSKSESLKLQKAIDEQNTRSGFHSSLGEYNWYPKKEKEELMQIDTHETQFMTSKIDGVQKKVQTSIVAYSPSPTYQSDSSAEATNGKFGIEVVQLSISNSSSSDKADENKENPRTKSTLKEVVGSSITDEDIAQN